MKDATLGLMVILVGILVIAWWPVAIIWSLNALFDLQIPFTIKTWFATALLVAILKFKVESPKKP